MTSARSSVVGLLPFVQFWVPSSRLRLQVSAVAVSAHGTQASITDL